MSGGGGGGGNLWKVMLVLGTIVCLAAYGIHGHMAVLGHVVDEQRLPGFLLPLMLAVGGLAVIFGSCECMILCVEGLGGRLRWNPFVAGTMAGLASNVPEIIMIGFVVAKEPRVAFVVACLTLHVNALVFGVYSALLPKDESGHARLPDAIVKLGTDLLACAAGVFFALGAIMLMLKAFESGDHKGEGLGALDLYAIGAGLLFVQVVSVIEMIKRFAADEKAPGAAALAADAPPPPEPEHDEPLGAGWIVFYGLLGIGASFLGGHAVGDFADELVKSLSSRNYPEMVSAIIVSLFSGVGSYLMIATAHVKGKYDIALSNVSGAVTQMPFVVLPATLILMGALAQLGVIPYLPYGSVLKIDLETTVVVLMGFPTLLILWKSISDDGMVNKLETAVMSVVLGIIIYFLARHG